MFFSSEVSNVTSEDVGVWCCEVESYVLGITRGYKRRKELIIVVKPDQTTTSSIFRSYTANFYRYTGNIQGLPFVFDINHRERVYL